MSLKNRAIATLVGKLLEELCPNGGKSIESVFKCVEPAPITIVAFADRVVHYMVCSSDSIYASAVLLCRLKSRRPILFCPLSAHKLFAAALLVATKFQDDVYYSNKFYAECCGVTTAELNLLEEVFLNELSHAVFVRPADTRSMSQVLSMIKKGVFSCDLIRCFGSSPIPMDVDSGAATAADWSQLLNNDAIL